MEGVQVPGTGRPVPRERLEGALRASGSRVKRLRRARTPLGIMWPAKSKAIESDAAALDKAPRMDVERNSAALLAATPGTHRNIDFVLFEGIR